MNQKIYLYDKMPDNLLENGISLNDWKDLPEITRIINSTFSFYGNYRLNGLNAKKVKRKMYIKVYTENNSYQYFRIKTVKKNLSGIAITAIHIGYEANRNFISNVYIGNGNGKQIMNSLKNNLAFEQQFIYDSDVSSYHQFTAKQVNPIEAIIGSNNGNQNLASICDAELDMDNYYLTLKQRIGHDNGFRIDFGKNLESIEETIDDASVVNRLFLVGGVPEDTDYDSEQEPITFAYLSVEGVSEENVQIAKRENSECKTIEELKKWGKSLFDADRIHEPKVTHEINMVALENTLEYQRIYNKLTSLRFGDTAYVSLKNLDIEVQERMIEYVWYPTICKYKSIVLGNDMGMYTSSVDTQITSVRQKLETRSEEIISAVINATNWITGTKGGYVLMRPKNAPQEILIMDEADANKAKKVWRWNLGGLGYSKNGVNGPYETAITQDGAIVADFITAGTLQGIKIRSIDANFIVEIYQGKIRFLKKNGTSESEMIAFTPTYSSGELKGINLLQNQGYSFALSSKGSNGAYLNVLEIPADSTADDRKINLFGKVNISDGSLTVNGVEITGNSGGGGETPSELTTEQEKNAWAIWSYLKSIGYTEQAAAGILGNIDAESTIMPDTDQIGGPAYGLVQWDGSAYPLVGSPTYNGRQYVQNLLAAAGIAGDYRNVTTQIKLLEWCMYNGQWIGAVNPLSVAGYKATTDINNATYAFLKNFERAGVEALAHRQTQANYWYNRLHGLNPSGGTWRNPVRTAYTITQEWDQIGWGTNKIHGGIDIAASPTNVYAARSGTVRTVTYDPTGGNYVIVQHSDGYWTYYGHFSSVSVAVGDQVTTDTALGIMGQTGLATGVHLHFEVWKGGQWQRINPRDVINF